MVETPSQELCDFLIWALSVAQELLRECIGLWRRWGWIIVTPSCSVIWELETQSDFSLPKLSVNCMCSDSRDFPLRFVQTAETRTEWFESCISPGVLGRQVKPQCAPMELIKTASLGECYTLVAAFLFLNDLRFIHCFPLHCWRHRTSL